MHGTSVVSSNVLDNSAAGWQLEAALASAGVTTAASATVAGAVSDGNGAEISGSETLEFAAASAANVDFLPGATGTLKLDQSENFSGTVAGFSAGDAIDLGDIAFGAGTTLGYMANAGGSGGTLLVSDGTHTADLALLGQYAAAGFAAAPDPSSGTLVTYLAQISSGDMTSLTNPQH